MIRTITVFDKSGGRHKARVLDCEDWAAVIGTASLEEIQAKARAVIFQLLARSLGREDVDTVAEVFGLGAANLVARVSLVAIEGPSSGSFDDRRTM